MAVVVIDTIKPKNQGTFPVVEAVDVKVTNSKRLDAALNDKANQSDLETLSTAVAGKQNALTTEQLAACNSGITSELVTQIGTNTTAIAGKASTSDVNAALALKADDSKVDDVEAEQATLSARMDNFAALSEGSTTGDAELTDIRVDVYGNTYADAGSSVRGQITNVKNDVAASKWDISTTWTDNNYIYAANGYTSSGEYLSRTDFIEVPSFAKTLRFMGIKNAAVYGNMGLAFYTAADETSYISGESYTNGSEDVIVSVPATAKYIRYTISTSKKATHRVFFVIKEALDSISTIIQDVPKMIKGGTSVNVKTAPYDDFNTFPINTVTTIAFPFKTIDNAPELGYDYGCVAFVYSNNPAATTGIVQIVVSGNGKMAFRINYGNYWSAWRIVARMTDVSDAIAQLNANTPYTSLSVFEKFGVVGDSFASGEIWDANNTYRDYYNLSWGQIMARQFGTTCTNYSAGGLTTRSWLTNSVGLPKVLSSSAENIYYLALGINDYYSLGLAYLGTIDDIKEDYTQNADTFYGNYGKIIAQIQSHAPNAKLVMFTIASVSGDAPAFNEAIIAIANKFNIPYIVQREDAFFTSEFYGKMINGHPVAISYSGMAQAFARLLNKCMIDNWNYFKDYVG